MLKIKRRNTTLNQNFKLTTRGAFYRWNNPVVFSNKRVSLAQKASFDYILLSCILDELNNVLAFKRQYRGCIFGRYNAKRIGVDND